MILRIMRPTVVRLSSSEASLMMDLAPAKAAVQAGAIEARLHALLPVKSSPIAFAIRLSEIPPALGQEQCDGHERTIATLRKSIRADQCWNTSAYRNEIVFRDAPKV